jgi:hypothetical protein
VPARRSGMGAAAVTAGREMGGVLGIAVLGAIVNGLLVGKLTGRLADIGVPAAYRSVVIDAVRHGAAVPKPSPAHGSLLQQIAQRIRQTLTDRAVDAGKSAYVDSLRVALIVAICVLAAGAVTVWLLLRHADSDTPTTVGGRC